MNANDKELDNLFSYHAPREDQVPRYEAIRFSGRGMSQVILENCPPGADRSAAIRKVREAVMTANAAIACGEADGPMPEESQMGGLDK